MKKLAILPLLLSLAGCTAGATQPTLEFSAINLDGSQAIASPAPSATTSDSPSPDATESSSPSATESSSPSASSEERDDDDEIEYAQDRYAEIEIDDQSGDGTSVRISEIQIAGSNSFLVIYNKNGVVLGSALVTAQSQPVQVRLDQPLESSQELEAALYLDNGDGIFRLNEDLPILDEERDLVHEDFYYQVSTTDE